MSDKFKIKPGQQVALQNLFKNAGFVDKTAQLWLAQQLTGKAVRTLADLSQDDWRAIRNYAYPNWMDEEWVVCREYAVMLAEYRETYLELMGQKRLF